MSFQYAEYRPPRIWAHDIETFWSLQTPPPVPHNLTEILPADGRIELMFSFAGRSTRQADGHDPDGNSWVFQQTSL